MGKAIHILNVEDSQQDVTIINGHLSLAGYEIVSERVENADAMRSALASKNWDIILCDYSMANFNALGALATLHTAKCDIPLIIVSSTVGEEVVVGAMRSGANDYLSKGNLNRLAPAIERELNEAENRRSQRQTAKERKIIFEIIQGIISTPNLDDFFTLVHRSLKQLVYAENCFVLRQEPNSNLVHFDFWADRHAPKPDPRPADRGFASYVLRTGKPLLITKEIRGRLKKEGEAEATGTASASWVGVPLRTPVRTIGVLALQHYEKEGVYSARDVDFIASVGDQIALAIERKRSEEALRESEARYRMLFEYAPDGILILDPEAYNLDANSSMCRILGYSHDEIVGLNSQNLLSVNTRNGASRSEEIYTTAEVNQEWQLRRKNGTVFSADVIATKMPDGNLLAMIRDITDRKRAERERALLTTQIENQRERLNNIVANVPGVVWESIGSPASTTITGGFVSEFVATMIGYTADEWLAVPNFWLSIVHPDYRDKVARDAAAAFSDGESYVQEFPWIAKDGRIVWVEAHSAVIFGPDESPVGVRGVTIDITDRKRAAGALRESEERYRDLVENAIDMIYAHDLEGNYTSVNRAVERITGYTPEESLNMNLRQTVAPEFIEKAKEMIAVKLAGKGDTAYELEIIAKDGSRIAVEVNTRLISENGVPVSVQGIARDTTERKHLEEQFRQSQKMEAIGLLAGGIAHDFNNLLTAISGYSELTLSKMAKTDPLRHNISEIKEAGDRAATLTGQLLAFSRKQVLRPRVHSLNFVITNIQKMLRRIIKESIEFRIILDPKLRNIKADPGQIEQVIMNLSVNARDAMPNGGTLTITTENIDAREGPMGENVDFDSGRLVKMTIIDTGEGMSEETQRRMFEPFFTTKDAGKGTGLGLSTVYGIVKQSDGEIKVQSYTGQGTTFEIYLPSVDAAVESVKQSENGDFMAKGNETILLVEDEDIVRKLVHEILVSHGYRVLNASSGKAALELCQNSSEPIHLLLTDIVMPGMSGLELKDNIIKLRPEIRVLLMSGYTDDSVSPVNRLDERTSFLEKPFTTENLTRKIRESLAVEVLTP